MAKKPARSVLEKNPPLPRIAEQDMTEAAKARLDKIIPRRMVDSEPEDESQELEDFEKELDELDSGDSQDSQDSQDDQEEVEIDPKLEKALRSGGKIRDQIAGKWPAGYRECLGCGRGVHIKTNVCPLCGTDQPRKEPSPNAGTRGPRAAAAPAPSIDDLFALVDATVAFADEYDSVDQAIDDIETVTDFLATCGGKDKAIAMLEKYKLRKK